MIKMIGRLVRCKYIGRYITIVVIIVISSGLINWSFADTPQKINLQGRLTDADNVNKDGVFDITFSVWDSGPGFTGTELWRENQEVHVNNGIYQVYIGGVGNNELDPYSDLSDIFTGNELWLQIQVSPDTTAMVPRQRMVSVGYSINSDKLDGKDAPDGVIVGISDNQTITNKTIDGDENELQDIADTSLSESYLKADGSRAAAGNLDIDSYRITDLGAPVDDDDASTKEYVDTRVKPRTYIGHADIDKDVSEKVYIHLSAGVTSVKLYIWSEKFNSQYYSEMAYHNHVCSGAVDSADHTHALSNCSQNTHLHTVGLDVDDVSVGETTAYAIGNHSNRTVLRFFGQSDIVDTNRRIQIDARGTPHWIDVNFENNSHKHGIYSSGSHQHSVAALTIVSKGTPSGPALNENGIKDWFKALKIYIDKDGNGDPIDKTNSILGNPTWASNGSSEENIIQEAISQEYKDIINLLSGDIAGEHIIIFSESSDDNDAGGRIRYNIYVE